MFGPSARRSARVQSRKAPHHRRRMAPQIAAPFFSRHQHPVQRKPQLQPAWCAARVRKAQGRAPRGLLR